MSSSKEDIVVKLTVAQYELVRGQTEWLERTARGQTKAVARRIIKKLDDAFERACSK